MKRSFLIVAAVSALLAGCAGRPHPGPGGYGGHGDRPMGMGMVRVLDPSRPMVSVVGDKIIVVDQEPLVFGPDQKDVTIVWSLPSDSKYRFPKDGIVVDKPGEEIVRCQPLDGGLRYSCLNRNSTPTQVKYSYTIRLMAGDRAIASDPTIVNMRGGL